MWIIVALLLGTIGAVVVTAAPASAYAYGDKLCSEGDFTQNVSVPYSWTLNTVHATSDFKDDSNGYSFRTCGWVGTNHTYRYKCSSEPTNGWVLNIVSREENGNGRRVQAAVTCDGNYRTVAWTLSHNGHEVVHFHLWAPAVNWWEDPTDCGETCPRYLYGLTATVN